MEDNLMKLKRKIEEDKATIRYIKHCKKVKIDRIIISSSLSIFTEVSYRELFFNFNK